MAQQLPHHHQEALTNGSASQPASRSQRTLSWQAAMGASGELGSKDVNTIRAASPPNAASNGTRSSGSRRKEADSRSKRSTAADTTSAKSSKGRGDSRSREKGKSGSTHGAEKPKNPVADYLRQRLMGVEPKTAESREPSPKPALRSRLVRLPTKAAPHSRFTCVLPGQGHVKC